MTTYTMQEVKDLVVGPRLTPTECLAAIEEHEIALKCIDPEPGIDMPRWVATAAIDGSQQRVCTGDTPLDAVSSLMNAPGAEERLKPFKDSLNAA